MSAALQLPAASAADSAPWLRIEGEWERSTRAPGADAGRQAAVPRLGFYRRHTENLLRRYLYASMQVGRAPSVLGDPVGRGWASSRPIRTFEDALIFVLDIERCLAKMDSLDREILSRVVLQAYTQEETATRMGMSARAIAYRYPRALDRLSEKLLEAGLLVVPE
jgi:hypothetical protein